jgi:hypothetical protein
LANDIIVRDAQGASNTEDLRKAMLYHRAPFQELIGQPEVGQDQMGDDAVEPALVVDASMNTEAAPVDESVTTDGASDDDLVIDEPEQATGEEPVKTPVTVA